MLTTPKSLLPSPLRVCSSKLPKRLAGAVSPASEFPDSGGGGSRHAFGPEPTYCGMVAELRDEITGVDGVLP